MPRFGLTYFCTHDHPISVAPWNGGDARVMTPVEILSAGGPACWRLTRAAPAAHWFGGGDPALVFDRQDAEGIYRRLGVDGLLVSRYARGPLACRKELAGLVLQRARLDHTCPLAGRVREFLFSAGIMTANTDKEKVVLAPAPEDPALRPDAWETFELDEAGVGDYVGWELEGPDRLFQHADGTVTHNTTIIANILRAFSGHTAVLAMPGVDLIKQQAEDLRALLPGREVAVLSSESGTAKYPSEDITVCSIDSLHRCEHGRVEVLIVDEPHAAVTDPRLEDIMKFTKALRYAIGATIGMRFDQRDPLLEGLFGRIEAGISFREAVQEGAICPIKALILVIKLPLAPVFKDRDAAYSWHFLSNEKIANIVRWLMDDLLPQQWQALGFIKSEKQARFMVKALTKGDPIIAMAKLFPKKKDRDAVFAKMRSSEIKRCLASSIYSQGVTFPQLRAVVNLAGGGPYQSSVQKPGRLGQIIPGKKCGVLFDFTFKLDIDERTEPLTRSLIEDDHKSANTGTMQLISESVRRIEVYKNTGYDVRYFENAQSLADYFGKECL